MKGLYADLPEKAVQRTKGNKTGRGYDTTGYSYQYVADMLNEVLGFDWGFEIVVVNAEKGKYKQSGKNKWEITVMLKIIIDGKPSRPMAGGHVAILHSDALKGAITNALKKAAALYGVGSKAFRDEIDDDNVPITDQKSDLDKGVDAVKDAFNGEEVPYD